MKRAPDLISATFNLAGNSDCIFVFGFKNNPIWFCYGFVSAMLDGELHHFAWGPLHNLCTKRIQTDANKILRLVFNPDCSTLYATL